MKQTSENRIFPEKITKPMQLLAAWIVGLLTVNGCFLIAATNMDKGTWESSALVIASIVNVPIFLISFFLLQTKYRAEMQEDEYYSTYINRKTNKVVKVTPELEYFKEVIMGISEIRNLITTSESSVSGKRKIHLADLNYGINRKLPAKDRLLNMLKNEGIVGVSIFGKEDIPDNNMVAISQYLTTEENRMVIEMAKRMDFDGYTYFDKRAEYTDEDVLFGAYGAITHQFL